LIARCAAGDRDALASLVARYHAPLLRYLRLASPGEEEDLAQETFLAAWKGAAGFRQEASVKTWLYTIARNLAFHSRRRAEQTPAAEMPVEELGVAAGWGCDSPEQIAIRAQQRALLEFALGTLAPADRELLLLRDVEGLSGEEAARILNLALPALKTRLHRARLRLMAAVRKEER
jgi:RNA polymerase sigma-70 factor (ECF subfamily)